MQIYRNTTEGSVVITPNKSTDTTIILKRKDELTVDKEMYHAYTDSISSLIKAGILEPVEYAANPPTEPPADDTPQDTPGTGSAPTEPPNSTPSAPSTKDAKEPSDGAKQAPQEGKRKRGRRKNQ